MSNQYFKLLYKVRHCPTACGAEGNPEFYSYVSLDLCGFAAPINWIPRTRSVLLSQNLHLAEDDKNLRNAPKVFERTLMVRDHVKGCEGFVPVVWKGLGIKSRAVRGLYRWYGRDWGSSHGL